MLSTPYRSFGSNQNHESILELMKSTNPLLQALNLIVILLWSSTLTAQMSVQYVDTLEQTLTRLATENNLKGVASAVVFPDGSTWTEATGNHGTETLRTDMLFDIGSNTKSMVAAIILLLEEEGALSVDDTLYKFISPIEHVPHGITLKQLLLQRSGVSQYTRHPNFIGTLFSDRDHFWHPDSLLANFMAPPNFQAGTRWQYSNTNYLLLGKVIEAVEGIPFNQVLKNRLFSPLSLDSSYLDTYDTYTLKKTGYFWHTGQYFNDGFVSLMSATWAAGGVVSTPNDFASWCHQLCRGDVLSASSMDKMRTGHDFGGGNIYGMGIEEIQYKGKPYLMHGGTTMQNSEMHYSLESDFSVVTMDLDQGKDQETLKLQEALIDILEYAANQQPPVSVVEHEKLGQVNAYPNPSQQSMTVQFPSNSNSNTKENSIEIYSISGQLVTQQSGYQHEIQLNRSEIGNGLYILKAYQNRKLLSSQKIVFY